MDSKKINISAGAAIALAVLAAQPLSALELITPVGVVSSLASEPAPVGPDFYLADNLINNSGLPNALTLTAANYQTELHAGFATDNAWVSQDPTPAGGDWFAEGNPNPVLTFTLGGVYWVGDLVVWGYGGTTLNGNEAKTFLVELSADGGATWKPSQTLTHAHTGRSQETLVLPTPGLADTVRLTITDNFFNTAGPAGGDRVGLGEVKFIGDQAADPLLTTVAFYRNSFGLTDTFQIPVKNNGTAQTLNFSSVTFSGPDAAKFSLVGTAPALAPGATGNLTVAFNGLSGFETVSATMNVTTNDSAVPTKSVVISGTRRAVSVLITPTGVTSLTQTLAVPLGPDLYPAINLINNSSLANGETLTVENYRTVTHPTTGTTTSWVTAAPGGAGSNWFAAGRPEPVLTFTLAQPYIVTGAAVWGYGGPNPNNNEVRTIRVALSADGGTTWGPEETVVRQRTGPAQHTVSLANPGLANAVRFTVVDNFFAVAGIGGGGDRAGLGEVKFVGQPVRDPYLHTGERINRPFAAMEEFDVVVRNLGAAQNLTIGSPVFSGASAASFSIISSPAVPILPGQSATVRVLFENSWDEANISATMSIPTNDSQLVVLPVPISGAVQDPKLLVEPASIDFGTPAGGTAQAAISVKNIGSKFITISPEIWGAGGAHYTLEMDQDLSSGLEPGDTVQGTVTFSGTGAQGELPATLVFATSDPVLPRLKVPLKATLPVTSRLVAYWPFNEAAGESVAKDVVGGHDGEALNVAFSSEGAPRAHAGTGAYFDGTSSHIRVPHAADLNTGSFTFTAWVKLAAAPPTGGYYSLVTNRDDANSVTGGNNGYVLYANGTTWQFWSSDGVGGWNSVPTAFGVGTWQHLGLVYDGVAKTKRLFLNGTQVTSGVTAVAYSANGPQRESLWIGSGSDNGSVYFLPGGIDEVAMFRDALTAAEIMTVMNDGVSSFIPVVETFNITAASLNAQTGAATLTWESVANGSYRVESSATLAGPWNPLATGVPATGTSTSWTGSFTPPAGGRLFLRVVKL